MEEDRTAPSDVYLEPSLITSKEITLSLYAEDPSGIQSFELYRNNEWLTSVTASTYTDQGLLPLTTYEYKVKAVDNFGNESPFSPSVEVQTKQQDGPVPDPIENPQDPSRDPADPVEDPVKDPGEQPIDECFIATAAFGSKFEPAVVLLRHFRDQFLLTNPLGQKFVHFYYTVSPPIAQYIADSEALKFIVKLVLTPIVAVVFAIMHPIVLMLTTAAFLVFVYYRRRGIINKKCY